MPPIPAFVTRAVLPIDGLGAISLPAPVFIFREFGALILLLLLALIPPGGFALVLLVSIIRFRIC